MAIVIDSIANPPSLNRIPDPRVLLEVGTNERVGEKYIVVVIHVAENVVWCMRDGREARAVRYGLHARTCRGCQRRSLCPQ